MISPFKSIDNNGYVPYKIAPRNIIGISGLNGTKGKYTLKEGGRAEMRICEYSRASEYTVHLV